MAAFDLARMDVARPKAPLDSSQPADFVGALDRINAFDGGSPGLVWRFAPTARSRLPAPRAGH